VGLLITGRKESPRLSDSEWCLRGEFLGKIQKLLASGLWQRLELARNTAKLLDTQKIFVHSQDSMSLLDVSGGACQAKYLLVNPALCKGRGKTETELIGKKLSETYSEKDFEELKAHLQECIETRETVNYQKAFPFGPSGTTWMDVSMFPVCDATGKVVQIAVVTRNIDKLKKMEEEVTRVNEKLRQVNETLEVLNNDLEATVENRTNELELSNKAKDQALKEKDQLLNEKEKLITEKEVLLMEINHRVKNNLQIILDLLDLQKRTTKNPETIADLTVAQGRVTAISVVYQMLLNSKNASEINVQQYLTTLIKGIISSYDGNVELIMSIADDFVLDIDVLLNVGLIVNEIVVNSMKYAFPKNRIDPPLKNTITVSLLDEGGGALKLTIADNGIGFPESADLTRRKTVGSGLIDGLVKGKKLGRGILVITSEKGLGVSYVIAFKKVGHKATEIKK